MLLDDLVSGIETREVRGETAAEVTGLAYDSRSVGPGFLYFCVPGDRADGHDFAGDAVAAGAVALVCERPLELGVPEILVADARRAMGPVAARFHGDPTARLSVAGITGTNGKTTTSFLLRDVLEWAGTPSGLVGTVTRIVGGRGEEVERTTPEAVDLQATFARMVEAGDRACVIEASSHALTLGRCDGIAFDLAIFTNLTQDHLDFHADMEDYFGAKRLLFESGPRRSVVNVDDEYGCRLAAEFDCLTYSAEGNEADYSASGIEFDLGRASFIASTPEGDFRVTVPLPGRFNVANALAALAGAVCLGVEPDVAVAGLGSAGAVPGRLEPVDEGQDFGVLVDYAHTPDSVANVLDAVRAVVGPEGRVICVVGAGGDRDSGKRPLMGRAAAERADLVVVTSDNPRSEQPQAIIDQVLEGIPDRDSVIVEVDRDRAIAEAIGTAGTGDIVVIAGKGHEQGQEFEDGRKIPFDDREVARRHLMTEGGRER